jgi:quinol monooxygenase YgiN
MLIAIVTFKTTPTNRPAAIAALLAEAETVRALSGCIRFLPLVDPSDPCQIALLHEAAFAGYVASPGFTATGMILRPMMIEPPVSRRFAATLLETVG